MQILKTVASVRSALAGEQNVAFVPTMGGLHDGHLALIRHAGTLGSPVIASIFVNRLQFGVGEDFDRYPRQFERDCSMLAAAGCDFVFAPDEQELYPQPQTFRVQPPSALANVLEGAARPGFFEGVSTVVLKLLSVVQPRHAVFGRKDYQQCLIIQAMVQQFALPVEIVAGETVRDADGLALSSRNAYLSARERQLAPQLATVLREAVERLRRDEDATAIETDGLAALAAGGWQPDYISVRARDLSVYVPGQPAVVLGAARLGHTRLIDNLEF